MYYLSCTMAFYNGMQFDSVVEAVRYAKRLLTLQPGRIIDVMALKDADYVRVVWTCDSAPQNKLIIKQRVKPIDRHALRLFKVQKYLDIVRATIVRGSREYGPDSYTIAVYDNSVYIECETLTGVCQAIVAEFGQPLPR